MQLLKVFLSSFSLFYKKNVLYPFTRKVNLKNAAKKSTWKATTTTTVAETSLSFTITSRMWWNVEEREKRCSVEWVSWKVHLCYVHKDMSFYVLPLSLYWMRWFDIESKTWIIEITFNPYVVQSWLWLRYKSILYESCKFNGVLDFLHHNEFFLLLLPDFPFISFLLKRLISHA